MKTIDVIAACRLVSSELEAVADPEKAPAMQAYMRSDMSFYGVQKASRTPILRDLVKRFQPQDPGEYRQLVVGLWNLEHREEKYIAIGVARHFKAFIRPEQTDLYQTLIVEGAWWDLVDEVATKLIGPLVVEFPAEAWRFVDKWAEDPDMWLRRTALICQVGAKERTDFARLSRFCAARAHEEEFFIRKAIGWALREYSKTDPEAVAAFINSHLDELSGLSYREGSKHIRDLVDPR